MQPVAQIQLSGGVASNRFTQLPGQRTMVDVQAEECEAEAWRCGGLRGHKAWIVGLGHRAKGCGEGSWRCLGGQDGAIESEAEGVADVCEPRGSPIDRKTNQLPPACRWESQLYPSHLKPCFQLLRWVHAIKLVCGVD